MEYRRHSWPTDIVTPVGTITKAQEVRTILLWFPLSLLWSLEWKQIHVWLCSEWEMWMGVPQRALPMACMDFCFCFRSPSRMATFVFRSHISTAAKREAFQRITWARGL